MNPQPRQQPATNERSDNADDNVAKKPETPALDDKTRQISRNRADYEPDNYCFDGHDNFPFLYLTWVLKMPSATSVEHAIVDLQDAARAPVDQHRIITVPHPHISVRRDGKIEHPVVIQPIVLYPKIAGEDLTVTPSLIVPAARPIIALPVKLARRGDVALVQGCIELARIVIPVGRARAKSCSAWSAATPECRRTGSTAVDTAAVQAGTARCRGSSCIAASADDALTVIGAAATSISSSALIAVA